MKAAAIIVGAGKSTRAGVDKIWAQHCGRTVLESAVLSFWHSSQVSRIIVCVPKDSVARAEALLKPLSETKEIIVIAGGETRTETVRKALLMLDNNNEIVAIHDAARPYITTKLADSCIEEAGRYGSAIPVIAPSDSLRRIAGDELSEAVDRAEYRLVQTPQCFTSERLIAAYAHEGGESYSDDAAVYQKKWGEVHLTDGDEGNIKLTTPSDIATLSETRFGIGYDVHRLTEGRRLIIGGVGIPHTKGLLGHSDADVLVHALMDAMLTAAGLKDIGYYFSDTDSRWKDADSIEMLKIVTGLIGEKGYYAHSISAVIMAQKPRLAEYIPAMCSIIATATNIEICRISISATTTEGLGIIGEEKGIAASAAVTLRSY